MFFKNKEHMSSFIFSYHIQLDILCIQGVSNLESFFFLNIRFEYFHPTKCTSNLYKIIQIFSMRILSPYRLKFGLFASWEILRITIIVTCQHILFQNNFLFQICPDLYKQLLSKQIYIPNPRLISNNFSSAWY